MKRIIAIAAAVSLVICCLTVFAADSSVVFTLEGGKGKDTATVTVLLSANSGISGASVNIIYDHNKVALVGYETGSAQSCDIVSVNDNGFGQVRFAFCVSDGYFRGTGELLKLTFKPLQSGTFDSVVYVKIDNKSVFDTNYREVVYSCVPGTLSFSEKYEPSEPPSEVSSPDVSEEPSEEPSEPSESFTSPIYTVDIGSGFVTDIAPFTEVSKFESSFDCSVFVDNRNEYVSTGDLVVASANGEEYLLTAIVSGDINCNGKLEPADYIILRRALLRMLELTDIARMAADMNGSGRLEPADYIVLRRELLRA